MAAQVFGGAMDDQIDAELDRSLGQVHVLRGLAYERSNRAVDAAAAYRAAWKASPSEGTTAYLVLRTADDVRLKPDTTLKPDATEPAASALEALSNAVTRRRVTWPVLSMLEKVFDLIRAAVDPASSDEGDEIAF